MTDSPRDPPPPDGLLLVHNVTLGSSTVQVGITLSVGILQCTLVLTPDAARRYAELLPDGLKGAADTADKHNTSAITLPDTSTVHRIMKGRQP